jgi:uncharacterized protein YihD (DUF1040 family)
MYAWLLSHLLLMATKPGWENEMSDYTDDFIFTRIRGNLSDRQRNYIYEAVFGLRVSR